VSLVPDDDGEAVARFLRETALLGAPPHGGHEGSVEFEDWSQHPAADPWREAVARPAGDPDAPLV